MCRKYDGLWRSINAALHCVPLANLPSDVQQMSLTGHCYVEPNARVMFANNAMYQPLDDIGLLHDILNVQPDVQSHGPICLLSNIWRRPLRVFTQ